MATPRMITVSGRPVSEWDADPARPPVPGLRWVPAGEGWDLQTPASLYAQDAATAGHPLTFTLAEAQAIKKAYWDGEKTTTRLARENHVSRQTIWKLVTGRTYWYA